MLTENAFAYNRGAHMGVSQSIADGLMGRCEMVWTTAGTNRVCGRCLELKDRVVGHTDESGVTIPPLHPRCRCAIMYREIGDKKPNKPRGALSGALNPDSIEAEQHAFRYYGLVRSMKTDCKRIAANTGFREQDIQRVKNHIFYKEHELYDGEVSRFYPSYHMAQSWQRLIDGRDIQTRDIILLNHEFLESIIEAEGFNAQVAHTIAEKIYNYSALIK